jgi:uncharacterized protein (TIGR00251 family)
MKISVKVKTGKNESKVRKIGENEYEVLMKSRPVKGAANKELIGLLSNHFDVKKHNIRIASGLTSSRKVIEVGN